MIIWSILDEKKVFQNFLFLHQCWPSKLELRPVSVFSSELLWGWASVKSLFIWCFDPEKYLYAKRFWENISKIVPKEARAIKSRGCQLRPNTTKRELLFEAEQTSLDTSALRVILLGAETEATKDAQLPRMKQSSDCLQMPNTRSCAI